MNGVVVVVFNDDVDDVDAVDDVDDDDRDDDVVVVAVDVFVVGVVDSHTLFIVNDDAAAVVVESAFK